MIYHHHTNILRLGFKRSTTSTTHHLTRVLENKIQSFSVFAPKRSSRTLTTKTPAMETTPNKKSAAVLYHYPCPDGAFAALASHLYFSSANHPVLYFPNTVYAPLKVEDLPVNEIDEVYLLDFVGPSGFLEKLSSQVKSVIILDHHKTAVEMFAAESSIGANVVKVIDIKRSGATIAYDYFKNKILEGNFGKELVVENALARVNQLFKYIEDGDLWRWVLPDSKAFSSGLKDLNIEFDVRSNPSLFQQLLELDPQFVICQGMTSLLHKQKLIDGVLEQSYEIALGGGEFGHCLAVRADSISELRSELGHQLANKSLQLNLRGIGAIAYEVPELGNSELLKISLRSIATEDTTPISQKFGGGGHRNASSFILSCEEFERWKIQVKASH